jgi:hypothetical protein
MSSLLENHFCLNSDLVVPVDNLGVEEGGGKWDQRGGLPLVVDLLDQPELGKYTENRDNDK